MLAQGRRVAGNTRAALVCVRVMGQAGVDVLLGGHWHPVKEELARLARRLDLFRCPWSSGTHPATTRARPLLAVGRVGLSLGGWGAETDSEGPRGRPGGRGWIWEGEPQGGGQTGRGALGGHVGGEGLCNCCQSVSA